MAAGAFSLTITIPVTGGASNPDQVDRAIVKQMLEQASVAVGQGVANSGNLTYLQTPAAGITAIGSWSYTVGT